MDQTRLAELAVANRHNTLDKVEVVPVEVHHLARPHPGDRQQSQQRGIGQRPEPSCPRKPCGRGDQISNLAIAVNVWRSAAFPMGEQALRRDLVAWVDGVRVNRETTHRREADRPPGGWYVARLGRPSQGMLGCDEGGLVLCGKGDEALQQTPRMFELGTKRATRGEILIKEELQIVHDAPPGQAGASVRNAALSTLA